MASELLFPPVRPEVLPLAAPAVASESPALESQSPEGEKRPEPEQSENLLREARLATRLRIEVDELANRYVLKKFVEPDPEPVLQFPSESHLRFARAVTQALRATQLARLDIKA